MGLCRARSEKKKRWEWMLIADWGMARKPIQKIRQEGFQEEDAATAGNVPIRWAGPVPSLFGPIKGMRPAKWVTQAHKAQYRCSTTSNFNATTMIRESHRVYHSYGFTVE